MKRNIITPPHHKYNQYNTGNTSNGQTTNQTEQSGQQQEKVNIIQTRTKLTIKTTTNQNSNLQTLANKTITQELTNQERSSQTQQDMNNTNEEQRQY
jgi:hypothetical protein